MICKLGTGESTASVYIDNFLTRDTNWEPLPDWLNPNPTGANLYIPVDSVDRVNQLRQWGILPFAMFPREFEDTYEDRAVIQYLQAIFIAYQLSCPPGEHGSYLPPSGVCLLASTEPNHQSSGEYSHTHFLVPFKMDRGIRVHEIPGSFNRDLNKLQQTPNDNSSLVHCG